jgi:hypothetical protein
MALGGASFVYNQSTAHQLPAVTCLNRLRSEILIVDFDEAKAACFAAKPVAHDIHAIDLNSCFCKERLDIRFSCLIRQVSNKQSGH